MQTSNCRTESSKPASYSWVSGFKSRWWGILFPSVQPHSNLETVPPIKQWPITFTHFPVSYLPIALPFDVKHMSRAASWMSLGNRTCRWQFRHESCINKTKHNKIKYNTIKCYALFDGFLYLWVYNTLISVSYESFFFLKYTCIYTYIIYINYIYIYIYFKAVHGQLHVHVH